MRLWIEIIIERFYELYKSRSASVMRLWIEIFDYPYFVRIKESASVMRLWIEIIIIGIFILLSMSASVMRLWIEILHLQWDGDMVYVGLCDEAVD